MQFGHLKTVAYMGCTLVLILFSHQSLAATSPPLAAWVQLTVNGAEARAVVVQDRCPEILLDDKSVSMQQRAAPTEAYPDRVCAVRLPPGLRTIVLDGEKLPVPVQQPKRIVVVGDTGCRVSAKHGFYQACNNTSLWPFAHIAARIAAYRPDLIIYTGDYLYRESPCAAGNKGCEGSPYGDNQATWEADWLLPAKPIHRAAPLLLARGNHETCKRAGSGWFRYLGPRANPDHCEDVTEPWVADLGSIKVGVIDSANMKDAEGNALTEHYAGQLRRLKQMLPGKSWLLAHYPFWGVGADDDSGALITPTRVLQDAVREVGLPANTRLLIGAHIHLAEILDFGAARPPQLVVANGGTQMVDRVAVPAEIDGATVKLRKVFYEYGFVTMASTDQRNWDINFRDIEGRSLTLCRFDGRNVSCP